MGAPWRRFRVKVFGPNELRLVGSGQCVCRNRGLSPEEGERAVSLRFVKRLRASGDVAADLSFDELKGRTDTDKFETLAAKGGRTVFIPPGDDSVERPVVFAERVFLFGLEEDKPRVTLTAPDGVDGVTGFTFLAGARIVGLDLQGGSDKKTLLQIGGTSQDKATPNEDDADSSITSSDFAGFDTAIRYNGRNCKVRDSTVDSQREGSTDVHLSFTNIGVDADGGRGTLPHYSHRKNSFQGNTFTSGADNTSIQLSGEVPVRRLLVSDNDMA